MDKMDLDPIGSLIKSTLKRSNSAPMINELDPNVPVISRSESPVQDKPSYTSGSLSARASPTLPLFDSRTRRYSASSNGPQSPSGHGSRKPPFRIFQLRQQEGSDVVTTEVAKEKECISAIQISQSWEDLSLTDDESKDCRRPSSSCGSEPLTVTLPATGAFTSAFHSYPSPTRPAGRQCFSPSMQIPVRNVSYSPTPSPSPTRKVVSRRSLSPIAMRASPLGSVKRKCDLDSETSAPSSKRFMTSSQSPFAWTNDKGLLMANTENSSDGISVSVGTPESPYNLESPASPAPINTFKPVDSPQHLPSPGYFTAPSPRPIPSPGPEIGESLQTNPFRLVGIVRPKSLEIGKQFCSSFRAPSPRVKMDCVDGVETTSSGENTMELANHELPSGKPPPRFMDDGGLSIAPVADGYFPKPQEGQSLVQYLEGISQSSRKCADLDRENAHFNISEVMISVIEQVKFGNGTGRNSQQGSPWSPTGSYSRPRSRDRWTSNFDLSCSPVTRKPPGLGLPAPSSVTDFSSVASSYSGTAPSSLSSPTNYESSSGAFSISSITLCEDSESETSVDIAGVEAHYFAQRFNQSINSSEGALTLERSVNSLNVSHGKVESVSEQSQMSVSAEGVALALIREFSEDLLPSASALEWVIKDLDAPQGLLPLPDVISLSDNESTIEEDDKLADLILRGTKDWAPPRAQIVFTIHTLSNAKVQVAKQDYRCAGCGLKVDRRYVKRFRYCEYLGKYFCTGCHGNKTSIIPARVLKKWDFRRYAVSNFAATLLERMWYDPLFNILDLNPALYRRSRELERVTELRQELLPVVEYIKTCRLCQGLSNRLRSDFACLEYECHTFSIHDLIGVFNGELRVNLKTFLTDCCAHVIACELCMARGFLCETCGSDEVIFPFQPDVKQCTKCGACSHSACFMADKCPRCARLEIRRLQRARKSESS